MMNIIGFGFFL